MSGAGREDAPAGGAPRGGAPAIRAEGLTRRFGDRVAVDALDLEVAAGQLFGFLGPNGAGKSTTIGLLTGMLRPTSGRALVGGFDPAIDPLAVKARVGVLPERVDTYERLTGTELVELTAGLHGIAPEEARTRTREILDAVRLAPADRDRLLVDYSLGTRKKTLLACALVHAPRVVFLDEPFAGLDPVTAQAIRDLLTVLVGRGVTVFLSTHVIEVAERLCGRLAILHEGRLLAQGTADEIRAGAGCAGDTSLHDAFVHLVGGSGETGELAWLT